MNTRESSAASGIRTTPNLASSFKSRELSVQYFRLYDELLGKWPAALQQVDVPTSFGSTRLNVVGPGDAPALLLLPGFGANSTMWFANVAPLSREYRVIAVDTLGQPGRSIPSRQLTAETTAAWLKEVLAYQRIDRARMIGVSLGGWIVLDFAVKHPEAVERIALLDPAASFVPMSAAFVLHSLMPIMIHPTRNGLKRYFRWLTRGRSVNKEWGELMIQGILNRRPQPPIRATPFSDEQLRSCDCSALLLVGEHSVIYNPQRAIARAEGLMPNVEAEMVPDASHGLSYEQPDIVNTRLLRFFAERQ